MSDNATYNYNYKTVVLNFLIGTIPFKIKIITENFMIREMLPGIVTPSNYDCWNTNLYNLTNAIARVI